MCLNVSKIWTGEKLAEGEVGKVEDLTEVLSFIRRIPRQTARRAEAASLGGFDGDPYEDAVVLIRTLNREIDRAMEEVSILYHHAHRWNENDYCDICGADGRT